MEKNIPLSKDILSLGWGYIDETYNPGIIEKLVKETISKKGYEVLQYNNSLGLLELRKYGKQFLEEKFLVKNIGEDEIMITNGATAGIDLASRFILEQGKYNSIVFSPVYDTALESLKRNSKKVFSIQLNLFEKNNKDIINWDKLEELMKEENTKLIYVNPNFQNPTGIIFDKNTKEKIYNLSIKYGIIILEDDPYKLYNFNNLKLGNNIINIDNKKENVIYLNSLSKVFFPGLRIGFLIGNSKIIKGISKLQKYSTSSPNLIMQGVAIEALKKGEIDKSIKYYFEKIREKYEIINFELEKYGFFKKDSPIDFSSCKGGFYLWGKFKDNRNTDELLKNALKYGVSFVCGSIYGQKTEYNNSFRLAYAQIDKEKIAEAILRFYRLVKNTI